MPFGFHLTVDTLPSGCLSAESERRSRLGCIRRFQLRARLGASLFVLPASEALPRFWIWCSTSEHQWDLNHLIWALPSAHYAVC